MSKLRLAIVEVTASERTELESLANRRKTAQALAMRARIVLGCASGMHNKDVAAQLGIDPVTVGKWRRRFLADRLDGLRDEPRSGAPRTVDDARIEAVITQTLESLPSGATHWSSRGMARTSGLSVSTVQRIWRAFGLQPHREGTFKLSTDPDFVDKVRDIVGLYVTPPAHAIVLCVDEKSQIQALDRSQPMLPMRPGQIAKRTHDYKRHGATSLFAALDIATGHVIGKCYPRHRATEFGQVPRRDRSQCTRRSRCPLGHGQLCHPQDPDHPRLAGQTATLACPLHPNQCLMGQSGRTLLRAPHRTTDQARRSPQPRCTPHRNQQLH